MSARFFLVVARAPVLPIAAHGRPGAGEPEVVEEVAADALHGRGFTRDPDAGAGWDVGCANCGNERVAGGAPGARSTHSTVAAGRSPSAIRASGAATSTTTWVGVASGNASSS